MYVAIHHTIADAAKWDEVTAKVGSMLEHGTLPKGLKALQYVPSTDGRRADCMWEAGSVEDLKRFLEPLTGTAARNEYFQINMEHAIGLPVESPVHAAAH